MTALREAEAGDAPALAALASAAYRAAFADILSPGLLATCDAAHFAPRFASEWPRVRLAHQDGALAGFAMVTGDRLDMLFAAPSLAGRGIGTRLLADAEARGAARLETFRDNAAARRFYERHGWHRVEDYARPFLGQVHAFCRYAKPRTLVVGRGPPADP